MGQQPIRIIHYRGCIGLQRVSLFQAFFLVDRMELRNPLQCILSTLPAIPLLLKKQLSFLANEIEGIKL